MTVGEHRRRIVEPSHRALADTDRDGWIRGIHNIPTEVRTPSPAQAEG